MQRLLATILILSTLLLSAGYGPANAAEFWEDTFLLDAYIGSHRSSVANDLAVGGYELSGGEFVNVRNWYTPEFPDTTILFLTQVLPDFGLIWGVSTGESGEKYRIEPALQLGLVYRFVPFEDAVFSIKAIYPFFGEMTEQTCNADYGDVGGVQIVNCRLAADIIPPEQTLDYLVRLKGETDARISISLSFAF